MSELCPPQRASRQKWQLGKEFAMLVGHVVADDARPDLGHPRGGTNLFLAMVPAASSGRRTQIWGMFWTSSSLRLKGPEAFVFEVKRCTAAKSSASFAETCCLWRG